MPAAARKHIPRYPLVSATLVGRLAVSEARQGERLGAMLLADARADWSPPKAAAGQKQPTIV